MNRRLFGLLLATCALLSACGTAGSLPNDPGGYRVFLIEGYDNAGGRIAVRDSGTGKLLRVLPAGSPARDWSRFYTVTQAAGSAELVALDPATGNTVSRMQIPVGYTLPNPGFQGSSIGLSPNDRWIALQGPKSYANGKPSTSFLIARSSLAEVSKVVSVPGDMTFDALSNDGRNLYLIESMAADGRYQVRLYDMGRQSLAVQPVADKREPTEPMNGVRGDSVSAPSANYVFTVYARNEGPFIHALPLDQPLAWCIDLPTTRPASWDEQFRWSLTLSSDDSKLYAVNGATGMIAEMTSATLPKVSRTGRLPVNSNTSRIGFQTATASGLAIGGVALSGDNRVLFALAPSGILAIDAATLKLRAHYLDDQEIASIRMSSDGKWLFAADAAGKLLRINPQTGAVAGQVAGVQNPWAVLWVASKP